MDKFQSNDQQYRRDLISDSNNMSKKEGGDPDIFLVEVRDVVNKPYSLGKGVSDARPFDIVLQGLPPSYNHLHLTADMESGFTLKKIEQTAQNMYKSRSRARQHQQHH